MPCDRTPLFENIVGGLQPCPVLYITINLLTSKPWFWNNAREQRRM